jgi:cell wall-associated NlpC family hydrolase
MISREAIVAEAREWIGTPFAHGQMLKHVGCDCVGLIAGVAFALGMPEARKWKADQRFRGYGPLPDPAKLLAACAEYLDEIPVNEARLGDILQYSFQKEPMHFAIISREQPQYVIHGYQRAGGVVENGAKATFWRLLRAYRYRSVG